MTPASELESDLWAFLLCALAVGAALIALAVYRIREKKRDSRTRRRYRQAVREERRQADEDRRQQ
jgi:hypothetical protein